MFTTRPPRNPELRNVWIMANLRARGSSYAAIAKELGISRNAVSMAAKKPALSVRCCAAIAEKLGLRPRDIWPERFSVVQDSNPTSLAKQ